jgi:hypothetical protein
MPADVVQAVNCSIFAARDKDGIRVHLHCEKISGLRDFARVSSEEPACAPDAGEIVSVNVFVGVEFSRQRPAGSTTRNKWFDAKVHA